MKQWRMGMLSVLLILAMVVGACGGAAVPATGEQPAAQAPAAGAVVTDTAAAGADTAAPSGEQTDLVLMGWSSSPAENTRLQEIVDNFNTANPDLNVTLSQVPDYDTKLQVSLAGGSPPDVFYVDSFKFNDLQTAGALEPLGDKIDDAADFYPNLAAAFTADDTLYCPPKDFSTLALFYNKQMFADAGVAEPTVDWKWEDLSAAAEKLTDSAAGVYGLSLNPDLARWAAFLYQAGGTMTDAEFTTMTLDTDAAQQAMEYYVGLVKDGFAASAADLDAGWPGEAFGRARAAMVVEGNWLVPFLVDQFPDLEYGIVELPAGPAGKATLSFTVCYAVAANGKNKEASYRLMNYLAGKEGMQAWTDLGLAMPTRQSLRADWVEKFPDLAPFLAGAEYAKPWQFRPGFAEVMDAINAGMQEAFTGSQTVSAVLENAGAVGNEVLAR